MSLAAMCLSCIFDPPILFVYGVHPRLCFWCGLMCILALPRARNHFSFEKNGIALFPGPLPVVGINSSLSGMSLSELQKVSTVDAGN
jgi:hypothetical protein